MAEMVADCPRCDAKRITFDVRSAVPIGQKHRWQWWYECFAVCRHCERATIFVLADRETDTAKKFAAAGGLAKYAGALNDPCRIETFVSLKDGAAIAPPDHLPGQIRATFEEAATCLAANCPNAAGTMFRLCVDLATRTMLPEGDANGLNQRVRRDLGLRLPWLFDQHILPEALRELSACIREDGNDGAHQGTLTKEEAEDLLDFSVALLERIYTEPERLKLARARRDERRKEPSDRTNSA